MERRHRRQSSRTEGGSPGEPRCLLRTQVESRTGAVPGYIRANRSPMEPRPMPTFIWLASAGGPTPLSATAIARRWSSSAARTSMIPVFRTPRNPCLIAFSSSGCIRNEGTMACARRSGMSNVTRSLSEKRICSSAIYDRARSISSRERALGLRVAPQDGAQQVTQFREHAAGGLGILLREHRDVLQAVEQEVRVQSRAQRLELRLIQAGLEP